MKFFQLYFIPASAFGLILAPAAAPPATIRSPARICIPA